MTIPLLTARAAPGQELYVRALASIYRAGLRVYDPDFALAQEPDPYEKARRDPVVAQAFDIRLHGVAGRPWRILPGGESKEDKRLADLTEDAMVKIIGFRESLYELAQAVIRSRSYAFIEGKRKFIRLGNEKAAMVWVPTYLRDIDRRRFRWVPYRPHEGLEGQTAYPGSGVGDDRLTRSSRSISQGVGSTPLPRPRIGPLPPVRAQGRMGKINPFAETRFSVQMEMFSVQRDRWEPVVDPGLFCRVIYNDEEARLGYGRGLLESIYFYLWAKENIFREGLQAVEKWARGVWTAKIEGLRDASTGRTNDALQEEWLNVLEALQSRHVAAYDANDQIDVIEGGSAGTGIVMEFLRYLDDGIRALILGSVLPFGGGAGVGSLARAEEEGEVHEQLVQFDRHKIDEAITNFVVRRFLRNNKAWFDSIGLGDAKPPHFATVQERKQDPQSAAAVISAALNAGIKLRSDEVYEKLGFTPPKEDDKVIEAPQEEKGGGGTPGLPGIGLADTGLNFAEFSHEPDQDLQHNRGMVTKAECNYESPSEHPGEHCRDCGFYEGHMCEVVVGDIDPEDWCKFFKPYTAEMAEEKWITVKGQAVKIDEGGKIVAGPGNMKNKDMGKLDKDKQPSGKEGREEKKEESSKAKFWAAYKKLDRKITNYITDVWQAVLDDDPLPPGPASYLKKTFIKGVNKAMGAAGEVQRAAREDVDWDEINKKIGDQIADAWDSAVSQAREKGGEISKKVASSIWNKLKKGIKKITDEFAKEASRYDRPKPSKSTPEEKSSWESAKKAMLADEEMG